VPTEYDTVPMLMLSQESTQMDILQTTSKQHQNYWKDTLSKSTRISTVKLELEYMCTWCRNSGTTEKVTYINQTNSKGDNNQNNISNKRKEKPWNKFKGIFRIGRQQGHKATNSNTSQKPESQHVTDVVK
jgi:hypothetical protein